MDSFVPQHPFSFSNQASADDVVSMAAKPELDGARKEEASEMRGSRGAIQKKGGEIVTDVESHRNNIGGGGDKKFDEFDVILARLRDAQNGSGLFSNGTSHDGHSTSHSSGEQVINAANNTPLSEEDKLKLEKLQQIRIKFLRLVLRLGFTVEQPIVTQVLSRLTLLADTEKQTSDQVFSLNAAKESALQLEAAKGGSSDDLNYSLNVLVIGKAGVGKSATINSIFGEVKTSIGASGPITTSVTEIVGMVDGVQVRVLDTPALQSPAMEQCYNRKALSRLKRLTKKSPPDVVLYVDRLDTKYHALDDLPLLRSIGAALGPSIWRKTVVTLTHAASTPPDEPLGSPMRYDKFVSERTRVLKQVIGHAVGDLSIKNPSLMNPIALVENHPSCRENKCGQKVLPNGQTWRPLLLLYCYSMKALSEASSLSKTQQDHTRTMFGFRFRTPPLPNLLSWMLQPRTHPKLPGVVDLDDFDIELDDFFDSDGDEYDKLLPFRPLRKWKFARLSREQKKAYLEEYDYRVKLLQKKQLKEELRWMREMKKEGKTDDYGYYMEKDDQENGIPLLDMILPPSFDGDDQAYKYRVVQPASQYLTGPLIGMNSWDHDCGFDGVSLDHNLAIVNRFPAAVSVNVTKDKKELSVQLDSSIARKHGEKGSSMVGFDIQDIGKEVAYTLRGETKLKTFKRNKTCAGVSVASLGKNVITGLKVEDKMSLGKCLVLMGSTGALWCKGSSVYGTNVEVKFRETDYPIGQDQSSLGLSLVKYGRDLALEANFQSQFSIGRGYKMAVHAGFNNKLSGQFSVKTTSSDQLQIALIAILPIARAIYDKVWPTPIDDSGEPDYLF